MTRCCVPVFVTERDGNSSRHTGAANPKKIADSVITVAAVRGTHTVGTCTQSCLKAQRPTDEPSNWSSSCLAVGVDLFVQLWRPLTN